ncbi:MAG: FHA domain-containing protein, partial [Kofleriaceae bacterium]
MRRPVSGHTTIIAADGAVRLRFERLAVRVARGADAGKEVELGADEVRVGTHPSNQLALTDPTVSRFHLRLRGDERGVRAIDLDSANGTCVGGLRVRDVYVGDGTVLELGDTAIELRRLSEGGEVELPADEVFGELVGRST